MILTRTWHFRTAIALLRSMLTHYGRMDEPVFVLHDGLPADELEKGKSVYQGFTPIQIDIERYRRENKERPSYWKFEAFNPALHYGFEKIIVLDADLLCISSPIRLTLWKRQGVSAWREQQRRQWNSGIVVVNHNVATMENYETLLRTHRGEGEFGTDQAILNHLWGSRIIPLPSTTQKFATGDAKPSECMFLHYIYKYQARDFLKIPKACRKELEKYLGEWSMGLSGMDRCEGMPA